MDINDLGDPFGLTRMKNEDESFTLTLPDPEGNIVDISKPPYEGKPKIIQIMGTWCPNCRDETSFLLDYLKTHPDPGFEIVGISFERHTEKPKAINAIKTYRDKLHIPYSIVYGGSNDKTAASAVLPMLNSVIAYPTLIFLNANNKVVAIHTGFAGPATSGYQHFKEEFDSLVKQITTTMNKCVLITGATSGIGLATAREFASHGYDLILTGRREDRLQSIRDEIISVHDVDITLLCFDVRIYKECQAAVESISLPIDVLINNAGLARGLDYVHEGNIEHWDEMIDTNVKGLVYMTRLVTPEMVNGNQVISLTWDPLQAKKYIRKEMSIVRQNLQSMV